MGSSQGGSLRFKFRGSSNRMSIKRLLHVLFKHVIDLGIFLCASSQNTFLVSSHVNNAQPIGIALQSSRIVQIRAKGTPQE